METGAKVWLETTHCGVGDTTGGYDTDGLGLAGPLRYTPRVRRVPLLLLLLAGTASADAPWRADGSSSGVSVERRDIPGSHFDELRLSVYSSASLERLCEAIYPRPFDGTLEH